MADILVATRNDSRSALDAQIDYLEEKYDGKIYRLSSPSIEISSNDIRKRCSNGSSIHFFLPEDVIDYKKEMIYMEVQQIEEKLKTALKPSRYRHTLGVAYTASCMAMVFGVDVHKAYRAGLLHDCAKGFSMEEQRALCKRYNISLEGTLTKSPQLMHQEIAPFLASDEYKEQDSEVLSAIACHTTGKIGMTPLEQIVFIADYMEPNRKMIPGLSKVRKLAFEDLDKCTKTILKNTIEYLTECGQEIDERTVETYKYYRDKKEN